MKPLYLIAYVVIFVLVTVQPLLANQAPGPNMMLAEILMFPVMIVCSTIGGAYAVMRHGKARRGQPLLIVVAVLVIVLSGAHAFYSLLVAFLFGIIAAARSLRIIGWGLQASFASPRPAHLQKVRAWRLVSAGILLMASAVFLVGMALAFVDYRRSTTWHENRRMEDFKGLLTYQMALAQGKIPLTDSPTRAGMTAEESEEARSHFIFGQYQHIRYESDDDGQHFTIYMLPDRPFPIFPYNYLTSLPSYRADETGQIRMIRVHNTDTLCPADAQVVWRVNPTFDALIARLKDEDWNVVKNTIWILGAMQDPRAVEPLIAVLEDHPHDTDFYVRRTIVATLGIFKDDRVIQPLIRSLQDSVRSVRQTAARALQTQQDLRSIGPLIELLQHEEPDIRRESLQVLKNLAETNFGLSSDLAESRLGQDHLKWQQWWENNRSHPENYPHHRRPASKIDD